MKHLGRTAFADKNEMQHLSLPARAMHLLQQYCISIVPGMTRRMLQVGFWERRQEWYSRAGMQLSLFTELLMAKACLLSAHPRHFPEERALLLEVSHAIADPHHVSQRGPIIKGSCAKCLEQASGHLPAPRNHFPASLSSKYLSYIILIRTDVMLYF